MLLLNCPKVDSIQISKSPWNFVFACHFLIARTSTKKLGNIFWDKHKPNPLIQRFFYNFLCRLNMIAHLAATVKSLIEARLE